MKPVNRTGRDLPPLSALRAFEAAARHGSMSRAATELNVTHGAVSRQIAALERYLDVQLFRRKARGIKLTDEGMRLSHGVFSAFERIQVTVDDLRNDRQQQPVTVTTLPTVSSRWLMPRLARFQIEHPNIVVNIHSSLSLDDLADTAVDFAIRYGAGAWPNTVSELLFVANAYPICSPSFLEKYGPFEDPADMLNVPLVHDMSRQWWIDWFLAAGLKVKKLKGGIVVDEYGLALQFALDGHAALLARDPLLDRDLSSGALVRPFSIDVTPRFAYYLVRDAARPLRREAKMLMRWLASQSSKSARQIASRPARLRPVSM